MRGKEEFQSSFVQISQVAWDECEFTTQNSTLAIAWLLNFHHALEAANHYQKHAVSQLHYAKNITRWTCQIT